MTKTEELQERAATKLEQELPQAPKMEEVIPYLRERAATNADNCMALLDDKKTLAGAYAAIEAEARKVREKDRKQVCVCFGTKEACRVLDAYYGFTDEVQEAPVEKKSGKVVRLFDML